ncbi:MAG: ribose-phosphate diphosphokinase [Thaumarchaeota archaeon]|jgi:ribose-phosphate pyrophosphokinase|nr:ribose-phosphate diphosphokinase [Candidatus Wolframiiraptor allenii]
MIIVGGPASAYLAEKISEASGLKLIRVEHKLFPDGENYIRFPEKVSGEDLLVVQGFHPPQDRHIFQAFLMADAALDLGARSVHLLSPYLAYARQDKRFLEGEAMSLSTLLKLLKASGYERVYTVNVHSPWAVESSPVPVKDILAEEALADYIMAMGLNDAVVVSVGKKGKCMAERVAGFLRTDYLVAQSTRDKFTGEVSVVLEDSVRGRSVLVVDDIISTGGTMAKLVEVLRNMGARRIIAACIHGLMIGDAAERILRAGAETIIASDTVPSSYSRYSVARILAREVLGRA